MTDYDDDPRYEKLGENEYFDTVTEEYVYVLTPEEQKNVRQALDEQARIEKAATVESNEQAGGAMRLGPDRPNVAQVDIGSDSEPEASAGRWPQGWRQYVEVLKARGTPIPRGFAVWAARFRAARAFSGVSFEDFSQQAVDGYFVGLKLTLAESALETYEKAMGLQVGSLGFTSPDLSFELWDERSQDLEKALKNLDNPRLQRSFQQFLLSEKDTCQDFNLRVLLRSFRHLTAHGFFNPSSAGVYTSKTYRALLLELADQALEICEREFVSEVVRPLS